MAVQRKSQQEAEDHLNVENKHFKLNKTDANVYDAVCCCKIKFYLLVKCVGVNT